MTAVRAIPCLPRAMCHARPRGCDPNLYMSKCNRITPLYTIQTALNLLSFLLQIRKDLIQRYLFSFIISDKFSLKSFVWIDSPWQQPFLSWISGSGVYWLWDWRTEEKQLQKQPYLGALMPPMSSGLASQCCFPVLALFSGKPSPSHAKGDF